MDLDEEFARIYGSIASATVPKTVATPYEWLINSAPLPSVKELKDMADRRWFPLPEVVKPDPPKPLDKDQLWKTIRDAGGGS